MKNSERASILIGLLWCLALLSVVVIGVLHTARMDLLVVKNYGDKIQAHYLALAGVERAKALLYQDARERSRSGQNHTGRLFNAADQFRDVHFGRGQFRVFRTGRDDEGGEMIFGVSDEESRLNVNVAENDALGKLPGMTPDVAAAIIDWRDEDNAVTAGGAEVDYYVSLQPPYLPRNGPLLTTRELLMVRGISQELLLGNAARQGNFPGARGSARGEDVAGVPGMPAGGWSELLTVDSSVENVNAAGEDRINAQEADERSLSGVKGISSEIAKAIVAYRGQHQLQSIADLLDVTAAQNRNAGGTPGNANSGNAAQNQNSQNTDTPSGPTVINENLLMDIADDVTVGSGQDSAGVVNINTASLEVLMCLPGLNRPLAQAIISYRQSSGFFPNTAWLLKVPGVTRDIFKQLAPHVEARSETYRILSEGKVTSTGARQRIRVIVHVGLTSLSTLSYREDDL